MIRRGKEGTLETSCNNGMPGSLLVESVMVMVLMMVVRVWRKDNDGVNCYAHGYSFAVLMVIISILYYGISTNERLIAMK